MSHSLCKLFRTQCVHGPDYAWGDYIDAIVIGDIGTANYIYERNPIVQKNIEVNRGIFPGIYIEYKKIISNHDVNMPIEKYTETPKYSEIIPGLYLGNHHDASNPKLITDCNIGLIINVTKNIDNTFNDKIKYHQIAIDDSPSEKITFDDFETVYNLIEDAQKTNIGVLVHCYAGISRSATIVIAYIMKKMQIPRLDALEFVRSKRPCVDPNFGFCCILMKYEAYLKDEKNKQKITK